MREVAPARLRDWVGDGAELAILDAREEGEFGSGHLFWAVPCPLSRAELRIPVLLPRIATRIVCVDDGPGDGRGVAQRLAALLEGLGATDVHVLDGGTQAWAAAGFVLFTGVNVPSKAFGEWVEHRYGTESVDAPELKAWMDEGRDMVVLDSRPMDEFHRMSIPTGVNVPGGELAYRIGDMVPSAETTIVVNCAGRTRSILGAESLRRAGVPNRVVALRNGTMGWELAGLQVARGQTAQYAEGTPHSAALALERARGFAEASGVGVVGPLDLVRFEEDPDRTLYTLDVRDPTEFAQRHRPGSRNAPGGQLVQATDQWIAVRGARVAVIDDDGVRARMAAAWLRQMGHRDVFVVEGGLDGVEPALASPPPTAGTAPPEAVEGALVIDLARSVDFRAGHIPGAVWGVRTRLAWLRERIAAAERVVLASPDGALAAMAVDEVKAIRRMPVVALAGGTAAWVASGRTLDADRTVPADDECVDFYLRPYDRNSGVKEAMHAYLSWEIDLVHEIERDGTVAFRRLTCVPDPGAWAAARAAAAGRALLDLVLPPQCLTCDQPVGAPGQFCAACFRKTVFISAPCCDACGTAMAAAAYGPLCAPCQERRPSWGSARAALAYDDQARRVVLPFKYGDRTEVARALAPLMARAGAALLARADLLVPVPLHRWRLLGRRYNQSALLAQAIGRIAGRPAVPDLLRRVRRTPPLGTLSPRRRRAVLEGVFEVNVKRRAMLTEARVLLIDDVLTTGATAEACTRALLEAGAGSVDVLAAARVPDWRTF